MKASPEYRMESPLISIITATYNSSHLLRHAIQSVINSDYSNWEMIVVGDCCTDDTSACVAAFGDSRIRFINLEENSGQQAKPNNVGASLAKGKYFAFLNQDDLFFPTHLSRSVYELETQQVDFVLAPGLKVLPTTPEDLQSGNFKVQLCSVHPDGHFSTNVFSVASTWVFKRELFERLGPWRMEKDLYVTPSQEWLFRAWKSGVKFDFPNRCGALVILSGERKGFYRLKSSFEHEYFYPRLKDSAFFAPLFEQAAIFSHKKLQEELFFSPKLLFKRLIGYLVDWILKKLGIHPSAFRNRRAWGKKGNLVRKVRQDTGLDPVEIVKKK